MVFTNGEISGLLFCTWSCASNTFSWLQFGEDRQIWAPLHLVFISKFDHVFSHQFYIQTWYDHYSLRNAHFEVHIFELLRLRVKLINSSRAFALSQYTSPPPSEKCVACHPGSQPLTLKPHFTCFKKGKVHSSHSDTSAQSETTLQQFQIRESVKQPTNWRGSANKIYLKAVGRSMAGLWMGKGGGLAVLWSGCK